MGYLEEYNLLKDIYSAGKDSIKIPDSEIEIKNYSFVSDENRFYPDTNHLNICLQKNLSLINDSSVSTKTLIGMNDAEESCNKEFVYPLYHLPGKNKKLIILFHGLNESSWDKYHSWAKRLTELTGHNVLMFPISFHINRRPGLWSASRSMNVLSKERKNIYGSEESSFVNAALSTRLQFSPELFFWSGLRSFNDAQKLINEIRAGSLVEIDKDCTISLFGYSIGAFLIENLIMAREELFSASKVVLFCGGTTMDIMYPVSKYIYDSSAEKVMTDFYVNNFEKNIHSDEYIERYFTDNEEDGLVFRSLLNRERHSELRVSKFKRHENRILAIPLTNDYVMPPDSVRKTLCENGLNIKINEMNFPYEYDHISPFPLGEKIKEGTDESFERVFKNAAEWLE